MYVETLIHMIYNEQYALMQRNAVGMFCMSLWQILNETVCRRKYNSVRNIAHNLSNARDCLRLALFHFNGTQPKIRTELRFIIDV